MCLKLDGSGLVLYTIESIHIIYKNLVRVGKELDVERFRKFFIERGFKQNERIVPTPTGPLKEYLLLDPINMRDLVVCSIKGFVVDSKDFENVKRLMALAYEIFEEIYGDLFSSLILDIQALIRALIYLKDGYSFLLKLIDLKKLEKISKKLGGQRVRPKLLGFSWGSKNSPTGHISMQIQPLETANGEVIKDRLILSLEYRQTDPDIGAEFINKLEKFLKKIVGDILAT